MVWGCMTDNYVRNLMFIDGILDKMKYLKNLQNNLKDSVAKLKYVEVIKYSLVM